MHRLVLRSIILGGCGSLMASHLGYLAALEHHHLLRTVKYFTGISAGSIIAFLYTLGLPIDAIYKNIVSYNLLELIEQKKPMETFLEECGVLDLTIMIQRIRPLLLAHGFDADMTFAQHYQLTKKTLCIVVTDANTMAPIYADHLQCPHLKVIDMILGSCCIPFAFGTRRHPITNQMMIDGIFSDAEPFAYLKTRYKLRSFEISAHILNLSQYIPTNGPLTLFSNVLTSLLRTQTKDDQENAILVVRTPLHEFSAIDIRYKEEHHYSFYRRALLATVNALDEAGKRPFLYNHTIEQGFAHDW